MPDIKSGQSLATLSRTETRVERNTTNLEAWLKQTVNEIRRMRIGDTSSGDEDVMP